MRSSRRSTTSTTATRSLDETDRAIVRELAADPRASYAEMGRSVGLSEASIRARVLRMIDEESVVVTGRVDPRSLGIGVVAIAFVRCGGRSHETAGKIGKLREAVYVVATAGRVDMIVEVRCRDAEHLLFTLEEIRQIDGVSAVESCTILVYLKQDWSRVGLETDGGPTPPQSAVESVGAMQPSTDLDAVDRTLIAALVADGRSTFAELGPLVDLSPAAVRARVLRLLDEGAVTIQTHTAPEAMGIGGYAEVGLVVEGPATLSGEALAEFAETTLVAVVTGRYQVLAEIWWYTAEDLVDIMDRIRALPGVSRAETFVNLTFEKSDYSGGFVGLEGNS